MSYDRVGDYLLVLGVDVDRQACVFLVEVGLKDVDVYCRLGPGLFAADCFPVYVTEELVLFDLGDATFATQSVSRVFLKQAFKQVADRASELGRQF